MKSISVVLCTFNGEKYIIEQLDSIYKQTLKPSEIVICDDNSNDDTYNIIKRWINKKDIKVLLSRNIKNLGACENFNKCISMASGDYIVFSDQDDVWKENKLDITYNEMQKMEDKYPGLPVVVHTDMLVVNEKMQIISDSFLKYEGMENISSDDVSKTILVHNFLTGCTMMLNRKAVNVSTPIPNAAIMHDWWISLVIGICGKIGFVQEKTVLYRQHNNNVFGASSYLSISSLFGLINIKKRIKRVSEIIAQGEAAVKYKNGMLNGYAPWLIDAVKAISDGNIKNIYKLQIRQQGLLRNTLFMLIVYWSTKSVYDE